MGKIILEFDSIEEEADARNALDGQKWKHAMWKLDQELRNTTKYGSGLLDPSKEASDTEIDLCDRVREMIRGILINDGLNLEN